MLFRKILIANRGEIALRVLRACKDLGIKTVTVYSTADAYSKHVLLSDESVCIGPPASKNSYLNMQSIVSAAVITGVDAIHPGIGFLSENVDFVNIVKEHGLQFIGPSAHDMELMGDKARAKETVKTFGIPVVPGSDGEVKSVEEGVKIASEIGFPVLIKSVGGGGGKGIQVAHNEQEFRELFSIAKTEAGNAFGNDALYVEKFLKNPRHIEVQVLADGYGNVVHLGERDCSIQRRRQKVFEETRCPILTDAQREELYSVVTNAIKKIGYLGVGTLEFLYEDGKFYFIEMNTRLQIEHTISEEITGIDLVKEQILVASGEKLSFTQDQIKFDGHVIECRINAENPETFIPSPGLIQNYHQPGGIGVRVDANVYSGYRIPPYYDSLIAKLIVKGKDRKECLMRTSRALSEFLIEGIDTLIPFHQKLIERPEIQSADYNINTLDKIIASEKNN